MTAWWTDERISWTVDSEYVERELGSKKHQEALHRPLAFGDGLTDDTYLDWVLERGRRFFLVLNYIGLPEWIFEIIDKSFDDDDLPLSEDVLWDLNLFGGKSETLDKKFYRAQFRFLVRGIVPQGHVDYDANEIIPVDPLVKRTGVATNQSSDKVYVHERLYTRKRVSTSGDTGIDRVHFVMHLKTLQAVKHPHIVAVWATYTQNDFGYILLAPSTELTLKAFLDDQPKTFKNLDKQQRRDTLLQWTRCLTSALAYLHEMGFTHQSIRPSNISIDQNLTVYLNNFNALKSLDTEDHLNTYNCELYEHAAPEHWRRTRHLHDTAPVTTVLPGGGRTSRRIPSHPTPTLTPTIMKRISPLYSRRHSTVTTSSSSSNSRPQRTIITTFTPPLPASYSADVFSLTTILLQLLSLIYSHTPKSFASHRARHNRHAGRGGAPADASFHANLTQVGSWIDMLAKEAKDKQRKEKKKGDEAGKRFWVAVGAVAEICWGGMTKGPAERVGIEELDGEVRKWVDRGLGSRQKECCGGSLAEAEEVTEVSRARTCENIVEDGVPEEEDPRQSRITIPAPENWPLRNEDAIQGVISDTMMMNLG